MGELLPLDGTLCVKCGAEGALIQWCASVNCAGGPEHHHRTCTRCGYAWLEDIWRDPPPRVRRVEPEGEVPEWEQA